ncbi:hypothetical protein JCM3765_006322 [Sporobolomyces pararoseus]
MVGVSNKPAAVPKTKSSKKAHSASMAPPPAPTVTKRSRSSENGAEEEKPRVRRSKSVKVDKQKEVKDKDEKKDSKSKEKSSKRSSKGKGKESATSEPSGPYRRAMYSAFLNDAFEKRYRGDNSSYNEIISQFRALLPSSGPLPASQDPSTSTQTSTAPLVQLRTWLDALTSVVSKLDQSHEPLVETILAVPWATTEEAFVSAYMRFIGALVSARTEWLKVVLDKCVKGFKYRSPYTLASPAALPHLTRRLIYTRIHSLLRLLLSLVPTLSPSLSPLLALHFPSKREPRAAQICYIDNILSLTEYCSALAEDVLTLVVERALNIDVEIQGDPEDWEEIEEEMEAQREAELAEKKRQNKLDDLKAAVGDLVDRPMAEDPEDSDDSDEDDDDSDDSDGGLDLENLSSDDDEPEPINDEDALKLARKGNAKMSEAAIRKVLDNRSKLDGILRVVLDHLAAAHDDNRSATVPTPASIATPTVKFGELSTATEFPFDFRDPQSAASANSTPCGSKEPTPTPADVPPSAEQLERRTTLFRTLLDIFDRTLLRTFKTRNVQFVLFYLCSRDTSASDHFVGVLLGRALFDVDAPSVTRVAAAGYVASFVARAKFVDAAMTRKVVRHLCQYLEGQMDDFARFGGGSRSAGSSVGGQELPVFYAVSQAVFYIFCFRWKDLLEEEEDVDDEVGLLGLDVGRKWMMGLETLKKAVSSSFNPLKVCAQPVVAQFASIAHKTGFMYCYSILEGNRRSASYRETQQQPSSVPPTPGVAPMPPLRSVSTSSLLTTLAANSLSLGSSSGTTTPGSSNTPLATPSVAPRQLLVAEEMDSFFPFDPFKLPLSSVYIDEIYREWEGADDDDDDDESDTATDDDSSTDASTSQASETEDEKSWSMGGLAVPGMHKRGGNASAMNEDEEDEVARSFEAMSISFSPDHASFGGRRAFEREQTTRRGKVLG